MTAFLLFDDARSDPARALLFRDPIDWIECAEPSRAPAALAQAEAAVARGCFVAGYLAYELGYVLEPTLASLLPIERDAPLCAFGVWRAPEVLEGDAIDNWLARTAGDGGYTLDALRPAWSADRYRCAFDRVRAYLEAGDVYQVNLTFPLTCGFAGDAIALYRDLRRRARAGHAALLGGRGEETVLSLSPELFLAIAAGCVRTRPMKGTVRRTDDPLADRALMAALAADEKQRAENLMIVDLLRNDLGRVAELGSVRVDDLFTIETYPTLHTMTSGISARLRPGVGLSELLSAVFPCGSVTGAPKLRAMQIIRELEDGPRGLYCGALGWLGPDGAACFNVAIRTLVVGGGRARLGVGSGVLYDSAAGSEYEECLLKAHFAGEVDPPFSLIETLRWQPDDGYWLLDRHLRRLAVSAAHFRFVCNIADVRTRLDAAASVLPPRPHRVRLLLDVAGGVSIGSEPLEVDAAEDVVMLAISPLRTSSRDPFYRHKTTRRQVYDGEFARLSATAGCGEVLFLNERGEITEGSRSSMFIERDGVLHTPPLAAGVLDGCLRAELMASAAPPVVETVLYPEDLAAADAIFVGNSVRGIQRARLCASAVTPVPASWNGPSR